MVCNSELSQKYIATGMRYFRQYKKHFTKMQKHVGLASAKNQPNKMGLT